MTDAKKEEELWRNLMDATVQGAAVGLASGAAMSFFGKPEHGRAVCFFTQVTAGLIGGLGTVNLRNSLSSFHPMNVSSIGLACSLTALVAQDTGLMPKQNFDTSLMLGLGVLLVLPVMVSIVQGMPGHHRPTRA